jgi:Flp pilus assembly protein TadG
MKKRRLSWLTRHLFRRGQTGQTIVILAFGFIVLLGFVGIVTDVSLMFVRYSTLRRAIDAAAVSAAGQMRRAVPTLDEETRAKAVSMTGWEDRAYGYAYARNIANVNLAARQFIELYGLTAETVLVDTCATTEVMPRTNPPTFRDPQLECDPGKSPRKLVRVTAQVQSPTVFLRLLGWGTVTLEATAISETAVLDVVMIFDVSESMLNQTSYDDWSAIPGNLGGMNANQSMRYYPPRMNTPAAAGGDYIISHFASADASGTNTGYHYFGGWKWVLNNNQNTLDAYQDPAGSGNYIFRSKPFWVTGTGTGQTAAIPNASQLANNQPRPECRVRFFPSAEGFRIPRPDAVVPNEYLPNNDVHQELTKYMNGPLGLAGTYPTNWDGFMPAYNFYGCCNDPSGNFEFDDLICQPMRLVRDKSEDFLERIDFSRGDRVAFVTFDRTAYLVDPDGTCPTCSLTPMMSSQSKAVETLKKVVGVRSEPSYYADTDSNGSWNSFVLGGGVWTPTSTDPNVKLVKYGANGTSPSYNETVLGALNDYPVKDNCIFQNATLAYPRSIYSSPSFADSSSAAYTDPVNPNAARPPYNVARFPTPLSSLFGAPQQTIMHPNLNDAAWQSQMPFTTATRDVVKPLYAYEFRAACRGSNVGAALRVANNALTDQNTKRETAVWVMVMLGDGAAAGSDPVRRNGATTLAPTVYNAYSNPPQIGDYGVYGVCPYGQPGAPGALVDQNWGRIFPYCSDTQPDTRHFCQLVYDKPTKTVYTDLSKSPDCQDKYDVDDFARDWADFIGLSVDQFRYLYTEQELDAMRGKAGSEQLPTIFTIGFGLDFQSGNNDCIDNVSDCLGEELLRYIADVGDNNRIDTDHQQDLRNDTFLNKTLDPLDDWGVRGPCEGPIIGGYADPSQVPPAQLQNLVNPLPPKQSCGNYFNAPDAEELQNVFDTIASRMFTRLAR